MLIHKETFLQPAEDGMPQHWVVQYWADNPNTFPEASYFDDLSEAVAFEETMMTYADWQRRKRTE